MGHYTVEEECSLHAGLYHSVSVGAPPMLDGLSRVYMRRLDEKGLLLYGMQSAPAPDDYWRKVRQAWFCRPVLAL